MIAPKIRKMLKRHTNEKGLSLVETIVTVFLVSIIALMFYELLDSTVLIGMFVESHNDLATMGERAINNIQSELHQAKQFFQDDATGQAYLIALDVPFPLWGGTTNTKLPVIFEDDSDVVPDSERGSERYTGNCLLMVKHLEPIEVPIDRNDDGTIDENDWPVLADLYRFQFYYLTENTKRSFKGRGSYLDLIDARSTLYADYFQLSSLSDTQPSSGNSVRQQALAYLFDEEEITFAWNPGQPYANAFYELQSGTISGPFPDHRINMMKLAKSQRDPTGSRSLLPEFGGGRVSGKMEYSVGFRPTPSTQYSVKDKTPIFATQDNNFPGGFEVLMVGEEGSRKVYTRLVLFSQYKATEMDSHSNFVLTSTSL